MKKFIFLVVFLCFTFLVSCRGTSVKVQRTDYQYAIIQGNRLIAFQLDNAGAIIGKEVVRLPTEEAGEIRMRDLLETSDAYYATTLSGKANQNLIRISKKDWTVATKPIKYQGMGLVAKGDYLYALGIMGGLYKYDKKLQQVADQQLIQGRAAFDDMVVVGDDLYVLGQRGEYDENHNYHGDSILCRLDDELNTVETIVLSDAGGVMNMVAVGNKLYMTMTVQGKLPSGEPAPADKVLIYDTKSKEQEVVHIGLNSPYEIGYNAVRDELYVRRDSHQDNLVIYHLYSPDLELKDVLVYPLVEDRDTEGFMLENGEQYLYADGQKLLIRDFTRGNLSEVPLDDFGLDMTRSLVLLKK